MAAPGLRFLGLGALTAASLAGAAAGVRTFEQADTVPPVDALREPPPGGGAWPLVSVIVPARNEERNLPRLLPGLLNQRYPRYEVIVVDDRSTDATPRILADWALRDERLKVVRGAELPRSEGWLGKPFAMHQGALQARGEWLLFTDADTVHSPLSVSSSVAFAIAHDVDLLSILPHHELVNPSERLVMPVAFLGITALYPASRVNDPNDNLAIANGQYMLIRRRVFDKVGGVARVKGSIVEDRDFAAAVKGDGLRLYIADGRHLLSVRMYTGFAEIWEGWGKNVVLSFQGKPGQAAFALTAIFFLTLLPALMIWWSLRAWRTAKQTATRADLITAQWVSALAAWNTAAPFIYRRRIDRMLGLPPGWTLTQPVGTAILGLIMLYSLVRLLSGKGVTWKGRTYAGR